MIAERLAELGIPLPPVFAPAANYPGCVVNCAPGFSQTPAVIDGCSDLLVAVFGETRRHARSAVAMAELPLDMAVEIELVARVRS